MAFINPVVTSVPNDDTQKDLGSKPVINPTLEIQSDGQIDNTTQNILALSNQEMGITDGNQVQQSEPIADALIQGKNLENQSEVNVSPLTSPEIQQSEVENNLVNNPLGEISQSVPVIEDPKNTINPESLSELNIDQNLLNSNGDVSSVEAQPELPQNVNVDSIISEISKDLSNNLLTTVDQGVSEAAPQHLQQESVAENSPVDKSIVSYNSKAEDTFKENHPSEIEVNSPIKIEISRDGVKEINSLSPNVLPQLIDSASGGNTLQYKNYSLEEILNEAMNLGASDVHLAPNYRAIFRIDGKLKTVNSPLLSPTDVYGFAKELTNKRKDINIDSINEFDFTYSLGSKRFRVNIFKQMGLYSIVLRVITEEIKSIESLGLPTNLLNLAKFANGLILITGPTGSGKSTSLASILNHINQTEAKHIITLEDPIEYLLQKGLSLIDQREYGTDFVTWPSALRSVLRQDPDIVLIGEMRDLESIEAALQVAETGHLVFGTLHTNSAAQSIDRIIDVFPAEKQDQIRVQLSSVLRAVVSQRLVPLATGGRLPVVELVVANTAVQNAIRESKVFLIDNIIQTSGEEGMISLEKSLVQLVKEGKISAEVAKSYSVKPNEIDMLLKK